MMTTWIGHLRIAEKLLPYFDRLDESAFTFGSLAPDSGIPNADWTKFDPPKEVSHYLVTAASGEAGVEDLRFYREYLAGINQDTDRIRYSFLLGYFIHLFSDRMWVLKVAAPSKEAYVRLFDMHAENKAFDLLKEDWYSLDQLYVRDHPGCLFWRVFLETPIPQSPLPFIRQEAFEHQMRYIREFYSKPEPGWILDRSYPYLNETSMSIYVEHVASAVMKLLPIIENQGNEAFLSSVELLPIEEVLPLPLPIGDSQNQ